MISVVHFGEGGRDTAASAAVGVGSDALQYLDAAKRLLERHEGEREWWLVYFNPVYFLLSQSMELMLKSFLYAEGLTDTDLRRAEILHSLDGLTAEAKKRSAPVQPEFEEAVSMLHEYHATHRFRYFKDGQVDGPIPSEVVDAITPTMRQLHNHTIEKSVEERGVLPRMS